MLIFNLKKSTLGDVFALQCADTHTCFQLTLCESHRTPASPASAHATTAAFLITVHRACRTRVFMLPWAFGFHERQRDSLQATQLLAFQPHGVAPFRSAVLRNCSRHLRRNRGTGRTRLAGLLQYSQQASDSASYQTFQSVLH
jgi:hypothetical protein